MVIRGGENPAESLSVDPAGTAALLGVPVAIAAFVWTVAADRSRIKTLERLTAIGKDLTANAEAQQAVHDMQTHLALKMLSAQRAIFRPWRCVVGLAVAAIGFMTLMVVIRAYPQASLGSPGKPPKPEDLVALALLFLGIAAVVAGEVLAVSGVPSSATLRDAIRKRREDRRSGGTDASQPNT
jgi:hypothetical protein